MSHRLSAAHWFNKLSTSISDCQSKTSKTFFYFMLMARREDEAKSCAFSSRQVFVSFCRVQWDTRKANSRRGKENNGALLQPETNQSSRNWDYQIHHGWVYLSSRAPDRPSSTCCDSLRALGRTAAHRQSRCSLFGWNYQETHWFSFPNWSCCFP